MTAAERRTDSLKPGARTYVEGEFGYSFNSLSILAEALDASGDFFRESNRRLALLGDKMAGAAVTAAWYPTGAFRVIADGTLTLLSDNSFANAARHRGLVDYIHISGGLSRPSAFNSTKTLATAVEAVLGAIYIDSGNDLDAVMAALVAFSVVPSNDAEAGF